MKLPKRNNLYIDVQRLAFLLQSIMNNSRQALESDRSRILAAGK